MVTKRIEFYTPKVGTISCVGCYGEYPMSFGNYFWLSDGPRIINMWGENLKELVRRNILYYDKVRCLVYSDGKNELALVDDPSVGKEWLIKDKYCVTGCGWGSRELCETILTEGGYSTENHLCGCEKPNQAPMISKGWTIGNPIINYSCHLCKRNWSN